MKELYCENCETAFTIDVKVTYCPCCGGVSRIIPFEDHK